MPTGCLDRRSTKGLFWALALCSQVLTAEHTPHRGGQALYVAQLLLTPVTRNSTCTQQYWSPSASTALIHLCYSSISWKLCCPCSVLLGNWPPGLLQTAGISLCRAATPGTCSWRQQGSTAFRHSLPLMGNRTAALPSLVCTPAPNSWALAVLYFYTAIALIVGLSASTFREGKGVVKALIKDFW